MGKISSKAQEEIINTEERVNIPVPNLAAKAPRILIFIGSLRAGGKERRLIELLTYFSKKGTFEFLVVLTMAEVHYTNFYNLNIPYIVIKKKWKRNDFTVFYQLYKICKQYRPHLIHAWGQMQTFFALPTVIGQDIPLINSQITGAPVMLNKSLSFNLINKLNFRFSKVILANSKAGIASFNPPAGKSKVIYNGINLNRFQNLPCPGDVKEKYGIRTPYTVLMVASFSVTKDYDMFFKVADKVTNVREDITFIGVGASDHTNSDYKRMLELSSGKSRMLFPGKINDVEALINVCTIGVLFSTNGEGISNSILEYMALSKPVIANGAGGTKELVRHNENGYLVEKETDEEIAAMVIDLVNDESKRECFGKVSKSIIEETFSLDSMGNAFEKVYKEILSKK